MRTVVAVVILGAFVAVLVAMDLRNDEPSSGRVPPPDVVNRIAYVTPLGHIVTVRPDGTHPVTIAPQKGRFTWPTWSPNGRNIAFSSFVFNEVGQSYQSFLHRFNTLNGRVSAAFIGEPGVSSLVALGAPHYVQWSPDSKTIAFIVSSREGLKMYATDISLDPSPRHMMDDGPLWFDWSPDSTSLIVHRGTDHFSLDADTETPTAVEIDSDQFGHRVATWTPDGGGITYLTGSLSEGYALNVSSTDGEVTRLADGLSAGATFQWSPNGAAIAVSDTEAVARVPNLGLLVFPHISIYDSSASAVLASVQAPVVSYFWSPDSTKIALVTLAADFSALQWHVLDVGTGDTWKLVDFRPSADQLTVFQYFDQYVQSHSMWSPDSESLVFSGTLTGSGRSISYGVQQQTPQVYVVSVDRQPEVYTLAEGTLAFWSPR